jgi:hypothetical protein
MVNLLQAAGVVMGSRLNGSLDLLDFVPLLDAHVERLLGAVRAADYKLTDLGASGRDDVASACFWQRVNALVAAWCHRHLTGRYICLRYEDLLHDPVSSAGRLLDFIALARPLAEGGRVAAIESWHARLVASPGIGRWRTAASSLQESIFQGCAEGLAQFGYLASGGTNRQPAADGSCAVGPGKGMP